MKRLTQNFRESTTFLFLFFLTSIILTRLILIQLFSLTTYDETLYLTHMRLIMEGKIPYHDFFDWVPPVWLYLYAGVFSIFGENVSIARIFSTLLGICSIGLIIRYAWKLSGRWAALIALAMIACVFPIANELTRFYYTSSAFFFVILAITIEDVFPRKKITVIVVETLFILATGTVQAFGLLILLYPIYLFYICHDRRNAILAIFSGLITGGLIAAPFLLIDHQATVWAMFSYSHEVIPIRWEYTWKTNLAYIGQSLAEFPLVWVPIAFFIAKMIWQMFQKKDESFQIEKNRKETYYLLWFAFLGIAFAVFLFNPTKFMQQHVYYLPLGCILVADLLIYWLNGLQKNQRNMMAMLVVVCLSMSLLLSKANIQDSVSNIQFSLKEKSLDRIISTTRRLINNNPDAMVFSFVPYFGVESGATVFPGTEYGISSFALNWSDEKAVRHNFFTGSQTIQWIEASRPDLIIMVDKSNRTMACCGPKNGVEFLNHLEKLIPRYYTQVDSFHVNDYWGEVRFFQRNSQNTP